MCQIVDVTVQNWPTTVVEYGGTARRDNFFVTVRLADGRVLAHFFVTGDAGMAERLAQRIAAVAHTEAALTPECWHDRTHDFAYVVPPRRTRQAHVPTRQRDYAA